MENIDLIRKSVLETLPYKPGKPISELERELGLENIYKLASNENPLGPSRLAVEAVKAEIDKVNLYPDGNCYYLKNKLAEKYGFTPEHFVIGNGSNDVIELIAKTFLNPCDEMIISEASFIVYALAAQLMDIKPIQIPMKNYTFDLKAMAGAITDKTKIIALCNPNNPTGTMFTQKEFENFMNNVPESVVVIVDEAYFEYVDADDYPDSLKYVKDGRNIIVLRTFSKIYGLAGLRIGYGITLPVFATNMNKIRQPFNVNSLAQIAAVASLDDKEHIEKTIKLNKEGMKYLKQELDKLNVEYVNSYANFLLINLEIDSMECYNKFLKQALIVRPLASAYSLNNFIRVTVGTREANKSFIKVLKKILNINN